MLPFLLMRKRRALDIEKTLAPLLSSNAHSPSQVIFKKVSLVLSREREER